MQTVGTPSATIAGTAYHLPDGARPPRGCEQGKKNYGAKRCCNAFLKSVLPPIAPQVVIRTVNGKEHNFVTKKNYRYLLRSAMNYASLLGLKLRHNPGGSTGEAISNLYDELQAIIGELDLNIETNGNLLEFVLWKYHPLRNYTFYWLPVKFIESLKPELRKIAVSFIHRLMHSNGMATTNHSGDVDCIIEWVRESPDENNSHDWKMTTKLIESYESGKAYRLMKRIDTRCYYKNLPGALERYRPGNGFEQQLIDIFREGLRFAGQDNPSIMSYAYDPLYSEEDRDYYPVEMERMVRVVYDTNDLLSGWMEEWTNSELQEFYDISPITRQAICPDTTRLFSMGSYPDEFFVWFDKLCELVS